IVRRLLYFIIRSRFASRGDKKFTFFIAKSNHTDLVVLKDLIERGDIIPVIDRRYRLADTAQAIRYFEEGRTQGKIVITGDHEIDGIVNVAGGFASGEGPLRGLKGYFDMLDATFQVAQEWKVKRVTFSSTGGMYLGLSGTVDEEHPIVLQSKFPILAYQKIVEVAADQFAKKTGISAICVRLMGMFGPFDGAQLGLPARLVHAAVSGRPPSFEDAF